MTAINTKQLATFFWDTNKIDRYLIDVSDYNPHPEEVLVQDDLTDEEFNHAVSSEPDESIAPLSLYIHIPFCEKACYFCCCEKLATSDHSAARRYLDYLAKEIRLQSAKLSSHRPVTHLYLGGGSPTFLDGAELTELMHSLATSFNLNDQDDREYTIEIDPRTADKYTLPLLKGLGFNCIQLGIQDFDPVVQNAIHRPQPLSIVEAVTKTARLYQFSQLTYNMVYGLPGQTLESLVNSLEKLIELGPDRICYHGYRHEPDDYKSQRMLSISGIPDRQLKVAMLQLIIRTLEDNGYRYIGVNEFIRVAEDAPTYSPKWNLRRNLYHYGSRSGADVIGLGVSSVSHLQKVVAKNENDLGKYYRKLDLNQLPIVKGKLLHLDDEIRSYIRSHLHKDFQVDTLEIELRYDLKFSDYFAQEMQQLAELEQDGIIHWHNETLHINDEAKIAINSVCGIFR